MHSPCHHNDRAGSVRDPNKSYLWGMMGTQMLVVLVYILPVGTGLCVLPYVLSFTHPLPSFLLLLRDIFFDGFPEKIA